MMNKSRFVKKSVILLTAVMTAAIFMMSHIIRHIFVKPTNANFVYPVYGILLRRNMDSVNVVISSGFIVDIQIG